MSISQLSISCEELLNSCQNVIKEQDEVIITQENLINAQKGAMDNYLKQLEDLKYQQEKTESINSVMAWGGSAILASVVILIFSKNLKINF